MFGNNTGDKSLGREKIVLFWCFSHSYEFPFFPLNILRSSPSFWISCLHLWHRRLLSIIHICISSISVFQCSASIWSLLLLLWHNTGRFRMRVQSFLFTLNQSPPDSPVQILPQQGSQRVPTGTGRVDSAWADDVFQRRKSRHDLSWVHFLIRGYGEEVAALEASRLWIGSVMGLIFSRWRVSAVDLASWSRSRILSAVSKQETTMWILAVASEHFPRS